MNRRTMMAGAGLAVVAGVVLWLFSGAEQADVSVHLSIDPTPPVVGDAELSVLLTQSDGAKIEGATVRAEGNMNHAGMKPSFADLSETEPGLYSGTLDFTMGGDWFVLVTGTTSDGESFERKVDVRGVRAR